MARLWHRTILMALLALLVTSPVTMADQNGNASDATSFKDKQNQANQTRVAPPSLPVAVSTPIKLATDPQAAGSTSKPAPNPRVAVSTFTPAPNPRVAVNASSKPFYASEYLSVGNTGLDYDLTDIFGENSAFDFPSESASSTHFVFSPVVKPKETKGSNDHRPAGGHSIYSPGVATLAELKKIPRDSFSPPIEEVAIDHIVLNLPDGEPFHTPPPLTDESFPETHSEVHFVGIESPYQSNGPYFLPGRSIPKVVNKPGSPNSSYTHIQAQVDQTPVNQGPFNYPRNVQTEHISGPILSAANSAPIQVGAPPRLYYGAPQAGAPFSASYGAPPQPSAPPSSTYGAPPQPSAPPSSTYSAPPQPSAPPSSNYGAPLQANALPSSTYSAPPQAGANQTSAYGAPPQAVSPLSYTYGAPPQAVAPLSSTYGAPPQAVSPLSSTYGAPPQAVAPLSSTYGAPPQAVAPLSSGRGTPPQASAPISSAYGAPPQAGTSLIQMYAASPEDLSGTVSNYNGVSADSYSYEVLSEEVKEEPYSGFLSTLWRTGSPREAASGYASDLWNRFTKGVGTEAAKKSKIILSKAAPFVKKVVGAKAVESFYQGDGAGTPGINGVLASVATVVADSGVPAAADGAPPAVLEHVLPEAPLLSLNAMHTDPQASYGAPPALPAISTPSWPVIATIASKLEDAGQPLPPASGQTVKYHVEESAKHVVPQSPTKYNFSEPVKYNVQAPEHHDVVLQGPTISVAETRPADPAHQHSYPAAPQPGYTPSVQYGPPPAQSQAAQASVLYMETLQAQQVQDYSYLPPQASHLIRNQGAEQQAKQSVTTQPRLGIFAIVDKAREGYNTFYNTIEYGRNLTNQATAVLGGFWPGNWFRSTNALSQLGESPPAPAGVSIVSSYAAPVVIPVLNSDRPLHYPSPYQYTVNYDAAQYPGYVVQSGLYEPHGPVAHSYVAALSGPVPQGKVEELNNF